VTAWTQSPAQPERERNAIELSLITRTAEHHGGAATGT
jgi:hypothetical protein